jgi:hypothetical protein
MSFCLLALFALILVDKNKKNFNNVERGITDNQVEGKNQDSGLKGKIYLTLKEKDSTKMGVYLFDFDKNKLEEVYTRSDCYFIGGEVSSDGQTLAVSSGCNVVNESVQIGLLDLNTRKLVSENITKSGIDNKKEMTWFGDDIVFAAKDSEQGEYHNPSDWNIFKLSINGDNSEEFLINGTHPIVFDDEEKMLLLRDEGLFLYDFNAKTAMGLPQILDSGSKDSSLYSASQLGISNNKKRLSIYYPEENSLVIYEIRFQDETLGLEEIKKIQNGEGHIFYPNFSSENDDKIVFLRESEENREYFDLVVHDLESNKDVKIIKLDSYEKSSALITDWVN